MMSEIRRGLPTDKLKRLLPAARRADGDDALFSHDSRKPPKSEGRTVQLKVEDF